MSVNKRRLTRIGSLGRIFRNKFAEFIYNGNFTRFKVIYPLAWYKNILFRPHYTVRVTGYCVEHLFQVRIDFLSCSWHKSPMTNKIKQPKSDNSKMSIEELKGVMLTTVQNMTPKQKAELRKAVQKKLIKKSKPVN